MLNPFPGLLDFAFFTPFVLRVALGLVMINLGMLKLRSEKQRWTRSFEVLRLKPSGVLVTLFGFVQIVGALMLITGFLVQIAALALSLVILSELLIEMMAPEVLKRSLPFYFLLFVISFSLIFTGAGIFAFDLPL